MPGLVSEQHVWACWAGTKSGNTQYSGARPRKVKNHSEEDKKELKVGGHFLGLVFF